MRQVSEETRPEDDVARDSHCARVSVRERRRKSNRNVASHDGLLHGRRGSRSATAICPTTWPSIANSTEADSSKIVGGG
jgi:hypothetical protein